MTIYVINGYEDPGFSKVQEMFYNNFTPDDWDYIIVGGEYDYFEVEKIARALKVCDYQIKEIGNMHVAVTYHS